MAFFYAPPPPSQGSASYTPPIPHEPQGSTGDQPPRRQVQNALAMALVLASWPADLEPRLLPPNNQQQKIAPLTLTYGQQPPPRTLYMAPTFNWGPEKWAAQGSVISAANLPFVPPVLPDTVIGVKPPAAVLLAWNDPAIPLVVTTWTIAPENPDQPPITGPATATELSILWRAWEPNWPAQRSKLSEAAWDQPPSPYNPNVPYPRAVRDGWEPPPPLPVRPVQQVWPTPTTAPPQVPPLSTIELAILMGQWQQNWPAQTGATCAAWNFIPIPITAHTVPPRHIWTAWEPPAPYPPRPVAIVPLTLPYGPLQTPHGPISLANLGVIATQWVQNWAAQSVKPVRDISGAPPPPFNPAWAENANQYIGPVQRQSVTH